MRLSPPSVTASNLRGGRDSLCVTGKDTAVPAMTSHIQGSGSQGGTTQEIKEREETESGVKSMEDQSVTTVGSGEQQEKQGEGQPPCDPRPPPQSRPWEGIPVPRPGSLEGGGGGYPFLGGGYPFLFTPTQTVETSQESEKYKKLLLKKQKREGRRDRNMNVFQAEDVAGHRCEEDIDAILLSLGEVTVDKKGKSKKPKDKLDRGKVEKKEKTGRNVRSGQKE